MTRRLLPCSACAADSPAVCRWRAWPGRYRRPLGQTILDDGLHANLAEGAARLLIGQDLLQADHIAGKFGQILLGRIDDRKALVES